MPDLDDDAPAPRTVTAYAGRLDRIERRQDVFESELKSLARTAERLEANQQHATELNKLRFDALDSGIHGVDGSLRAFIDRIEGILSGQVQTAQSRQGEEIIKDYREWRRQTDAFHEKVQDRFDAEDAVKQERARRAESDRRMYAAVASAIGALGTVIGGLFALGVIRF